jgi:hypothetical protein
MLQQSPCELLSDMNKTEQLYHQGWSLSSLEGLLTAKDSPCVSVIVNLHKQGNMLKQNLNELCKAIKKVQASLDIFKTTDDIREIINEHLDQATGQFVNDGSASAVGIFASETQQALILFPFTVNECEVVDNSFETRDLLYLKQYTKPYFVVNIGKDEIHLFRGVGASLTEIREGGFPIEFSDNYEYEHASLGTSYGYALKGFERDKGELSHSRHDVFVKSATQNLVPLLADNQAEIIVAGPARMVTAFQSAYPMTRQIAGHIHRSFNGRNFPALALDSWEAISNARKKQVSDLIQKANDLPLNQKAEGLRDVWEAARKGRGLVLLVERDFRRTAYLPCGYEEIRLYPPKGKYEAMADAVDDVIETVIAKHGKVVFTEPHQLARFDGIVLLLRY